MKKSGDARSHPFTCIAFFPYHISVIRTDTHCDTLQRVIH